MWLCEINRDPFAIIWGKNNILKFIVYYPTLTIKFDKVERFKCIDGKVALTGIHIKKEGSAKDRSLTDLTG
jgi:hypothetical protein